MIIKSIKEPKILFTGFKNIPNVDYFIIKPETEKSFYAITLQDSEGKTQKVYMNDNQFKEYEKFKKIEDEEKRKQADFLKHQEWLAFINQTSIYTKNKNRK